MTKLELLKEIKTIINDDKIKLKGKALKNFLNKISKDLELYQKEGNTILEKLYLFYYNKKIPYCDCGNQLKFYNFKIGYKTFCSTKCSNNNKRKQKKSKDTLYKNYGVTSTFKLETSKKTKLERYGNENYNNRELMKRTKLERYGNENYNNSEKTKKTNLEKYGVENVFQSEDIKIKIKNIHIEKYGGMGYSSKYIKNKISNTMRQKYNIEYPLQSQEIISRMRTSSYDYDKIVERTSDTLIPLFSKEEYNGIYHIRKKELNYYDWKCRICNTIFKDHLDNGRLPKCPVCHPKFSSIAEKEICDWIKKQNINVIENDRTILDGKEIDIYLPDYKLAIEYNGLYYHSIKFKNKYYHQNKVRLANKNGIRLLHVWEHEWIQNNELIKDIILYYINNLSESIESVEPKLYNIEDNLIWI